MKSTTYSHVIWDWNGTLLDDVEWCVSVTNGMLKRRGMKTFGTPDDYRGIFSFPIIDYYKRAGFDFDKEPFETIASEYVNLYHGENAPFQLFPNAVQTLETLKARGLHQIILSASELGNLMSQVRQFDIEHYFDEILGISDIYAKSKLDIGKAYIKRTNGLTNAILIGDAIHDKEVADVLGIDCLLIPNGHQSKEILLSCDVLIIDDLIDVLDIVGC